MTTSFDACYQAQCAEEEQILESASIFPRHRMALIEDAIKVFSRQRHLNPNPKLIRQIRDQALNFALDDDSCPGFERRLLNHLHWINQSHH